MPFTNIVIVIGLMTFIGGIYSIIDTNYLRITKLEEDNNELYKRVEDLEIRMDRNHL